MPRERESRIKKYEELLAKRKKKRVRAVLLILLALLAAAYAGTAVYFHYHFYPGTVIYGIKCQNLTAEETKNEAVRKLAGYTLQILERGGDTRMLNAGEIHLRYRDDGGIERMLQAQKPYLWPLMIAKPQIGAAQADFTYDRQLAQAAVEKLDGMDEASAQHPQDAYIATLEKDFVIVQEVMGNLLDREKTLQAVTDALDAGESRLSLEEADCYQNPSVYQDDAELCSRAAQMNELAGAYITYDFGDRQELVDAAKIQTWMTETEDGLAIDENCLLAFVEELAEKYDTFGLSREFITSEGKTITLTGGDYGWCIDQEATLAALKDALANDYEGVMEPVYLYTAMCRDTDDIGGTYVEVCISEQRMWCYENGVLMVDTPVVTGNPTKNNGTPSGGVWAIDSKMRNYVLRGEGYAAPVDYWMAFNGDVGIHDLKSRTEFGGKIYLTNGSHGCVNTPYEQAKEIYNIVSVGTPVVVYE